MTSQRASKTVAQARRAGMSDGLIADRIGCTVRTLALWDAKPDITLQTKLERGVLRLRDDLRQAKATARAESGATGRVR